MGLRAGNRSIVCLLSIMAFGATIMSSTVCAQTAVIEEPAHFSKVFQEEKGYRVYLPPDYATSGKRYPVLYWFHGHFGSYKQNTYREDFSRYVGTHDLIVVAVDGHNNTDNSTWDYCNAYEPGRYEGNQVDPNRDYAKYFPELVAEIDGRYRTIADRAHRFTSGQSRGGYMSPWIASQNKDLVSSAGMFCASPDSAMVGDAGRKVFVPGCELHRAFSGLNIYCTSPIGDRYRHYSSEQAALNQASGLFPFVFHSAFYPDHRAWDIALQLDYFLQQALKPQPVPSLWYHATPYTDFSLWDYHFTIERKVPAVTVVEQASLDGMRLLSRTYVPDGPLVQEESIRVTTAPLYQKGGSYSLVDYNLSKGTFASSVIKAGDNGRLQFGVDGGGHVLGINAGTDKAKLHVVLSHSRERLYVETGQDAALDFDLVNVGAVPATNITIRASSTYPWLTFKENTWTMAELSGQDKVRVSKVFPFRVETAGYTDFGFVGSLTLEIQVNGQTVSTQHVMVFPIPVSPYLTDMAGLAVLDGREMIVPIYENAKYTISEGSIQGGQGNGNGIAEAGEQVLLYVRLPQGLGQNDVNTFHPAYVLNPEDCPYIKVDAVRPNGKGAEIGYSDAANLQSIITVRPEARPGDVLDLWLKIESYHFSEEGFNRPIQRHRFDYRKVRLVIGENRLLMPTTRP